MKYNILTYTILIFALCIASCGKGVDGLTAEEYVTQENLSATELDDGVYLAFVNKTSGEKPVTVDDIIVADYKGYLTNRTVFDQGEDLTGPLRNFIRGWQIAFKEIPVGSEAIIVVPPSVGYGSQDQGIIPGNSTLVFEVTLKEIK